MVKWPTEPSGYQFTISDIRVFGSFVGSGINSAAAVAQALAATNAANYNYKWNSNFSNCYWINL